MRPIGDLISACFYGGELASVRDEREELLHLVVKGGKPVTWITTARLDDRAEIRAGPSFLNLAEVDEIVRETIVED